MEQAFNVVLRQFVQVDNCVVMELELQILHFEGDQFSDLAADWNVLNARFPLYFLLIELVSIEDDLVVEQHDVLAAQPFADLFPRFAVLFAVAHFKLDCDLHGIRRAVITPDYAVLGVDALELPSVCLDLSSLARNDWVHITRS